MYFFQLNHQPFCGVRDETKLCLKKFNGFNVNFVFLDFFLSLFLSGEGENFISIMRLDEASFKEFVSLFYIPGILDTNFYL